jgi:hypothetical protein
MSSESKRRERKFHLWGWFLFLVCAGFFIAGSLQYGNIASLIGSAIFLIACVVFLIPIITSTEKNKNNRD